MAHFADYGTWLARLRADGPVRAHRQCGRAWGHARVIAALRPRSAAVPGARRTLALRAATAAARARQAGRGDVAPCGAGPAPRDSVRG